MERCGITGMAAVAGMIALSSCASKPEMAEPSARMAEPLAQIEVGSCTGDLENWAVVIEGVAIEDLLAQSGKSRSETLRPYLAEWGIDIDDPALPGQLARLKQGETIAVDVPETLTGLGAFQKIQIAEIALASMNEENEEERRVICGKIRDYVYDESEMSGHLAVDTRLDIYESTTSYNAGLPDRIERYHWDIDVDGIYQVILRDDSHPDNPFPNTVVFTDAAKAPSNPDGIWMRGLDHKLFAQGQGIKVRNVYQKLDNGSIMRLGDGHPYYVSTDESCVDLLTNGPPPALVADLPPQRGYCLGRCDHPQVVNTH